MEIQWIRDDVAVCGQIRESDIAGLAAAGFQALVCNRPDGEEAGQPLAAHVQAKAEAAGLVFAMFPIVGAPTTAQQEAYAALLATLPRPLVAYCRSGARSKALLG